MKSMSRHKNAGRAFAIHLLAVLLVFTISCQSAPKITESIMDETGYVPLAPGAAIYLFADVQKARPILDNLAIYQESDKQLQQIIDQTRFAVAAANMPPAAQAQYAQADNSRREPSLMRYQLITWGAGYPAGGAGMALGASKDWKKMKSKNLKAQYWHSAESGISIAVTPAQIFVSAVTWYGLGTQPDPFPAMPGTEIPESFNEFRRGAILACWINEPSPILNQKLAEMGIPLEIPAEQLFISVFQNDKQQYEAQLRIVAPTAMQARGLLALFLRVRGIISFAALAAPDKTDINALLMSILFSNPPVHEVKNLTIKTKTLSAQEITLLFNLFSL